MATKSTNSTLMVVAFILIACFAAFLLLPVLAKKLSGGSTAPAPVSGGGGTSYQAPDQDGDDNDNLLSSLMNTLGSLFAGGSGRGSGGGSGSGSGNSVGNYGTGTANAANGFASNSAFNDPGFLSAVETAEDDIYSAGDDNTGVGFADSSYDGNLEGLTELGLEDSGLGGNIPTESIDGDVSGQDTDSGDGEQFTGGDDYPGGGESYDGGGTDTSNYGGDDGGDDDGD